MAPSREAVVKKPKIKESIYPSSSFLTKAEKRLTFLLRDIQNDAVSNDMPLPESDEHKADSFLRGFILSDGLALTACFVCAWIVAAVINTTYFARTGLNTPSVIDVVAAAQFAALGAGILLWFGHTGHYRMRMPFWMETKKIVETLIFAMLIGCFLEFVSKNSFSRLWLVSYWVFAIIGVVSFRAIWRKILDRRGVWQIPTLIVGEGPTAEEVRIALSAEPSLGYDVVGQVPDLASEFAAAGYSWKTLCKAYNAGYVVIALDGEDVVNLRQSLAQLMHEHVPFSVAPPMHNLSVYAMMPQSFFGRDVMLMAHNNGLDRPLPRLFKRAFDVILSSLLLVALSPVMLALAVAVKLDGGKAFYRHKRVGLNGDTFACVKFRSMVTKSDEVLKKHLDAYPLARAEWLRDHKLRKDPRITKIGRILRRTSLDELPQLINVLTGEMSLVGPRPIVLAEMAEYDHDIAFYYRVRPGMTGVWQVSGRNDVSYAERVRMDSWYVRNWSLWHDIAIMFKTIAVVLRQSGAY